MEIKKFKDKKGRIITYGKGSCQEVEELNKVKSFNESLNEMERIANNIKEVFGINIGNKVERSVYGKRKNT